MFKVFIGYDSKEIPAYHTCAQSIMEHATNPVAIIPLKLSTLPMYNREDSLGTTEFSLSRFLTPHLSNFDGWSLFMDCDMLVKFDVTTMVKDLIKTKNPFEMNEHFKMVYVCPHEYQTKFSEKATGLNTGYPRKNWSSVMLFNNIKCNRILTPEYINKATPSDLHRLNWAKEDIGFLPLEYNWLVGEYEHNDNAKILHYTIGTPCFEEYKDCDHSKEWHDIHKKI